MSLVAHRGSNEIFEFQAPLWVPGVGISLARQREEVLHWFQADLASGFIKHGWKIPELNGGFIRKIAYLNDPFSSTPCLTKPEGKPGPDSPQFPWIPHLHSDLRPWQPLGVSWRQKLCPAEVWTTWSTGWLQTGHGGAGMDDHPTMVVTAIFKIP